VLACALPAVATAQVPAESSHMTLVRHVDMVSGGEGFAMKLTRDGRRLLYVAHESAPHCFSIVDDRGIVYACDRFTGGLYILTSDVLPK
jgi:hypothetical protein